MPLYAIIKTVKKFLNLKSFFPALRLRFIFARLMPVSATKNSPPSSTRRSADLRTRRRMELLLFAPADFFLELCATSSRFSACAAGFCVSFGGVHFARSPKLCEISKSESRNFFHYCDFSINTAIIPAPRRPYFCGIAILCGFADWEDASFQINSLFATSVLFICPYLFTPRFFIIAAQKILLIET